MAGHAAAACKAPPPAITADMAAVACKAAPPGHAAAASSACMAGVPCLRLHRWAPEQAKALSQEVVQPKQESAYLYISRESAYYDGESLPTITYPCKSLPTYTMTAPPTNMNQGGCPMKAIPKELPAGYKAAAGKRPPPIFPPDDRPRAPAATLAAVDEPPAAPPPPFPQMQ